MKLPYYELDSAVTWEGRPTKNQFIEHIRPHIYRDRNPSGSVKLQVLDENDNFLCESNEVAISDMVLTGGSGLDYYHGYIRFDCACAMVKNKTYKVKMVGVGYTFSGFTSPHIGWVTDFDLAKYPGITTPPNALQSPLDLEFWGLEMPE